MEEVQVEKHEGNGQWEGDMHKLKQVKPGSADGESVMRKRLTGAGSWLSEPMAPFTWIGVHPGYTFASP